MNQNYLGQLVAAPVTTGLDASFLREMKESLFKNMTYVKYPVSVFVSSANALKVDAANKAVNQWLLSFLRKDICFVTTEGIECASDIDEQPHGMDITTKGAMNRLTNLKKQLSEKNFIPATLNVLVSLENGLMPEKMLDVKNPDIFLDSDNGNDIVWVDRCVVVCEIIFDGKRMTTMAISEGVTTPREAVKSAANTNWSKTAGSFIAETYKWNAKDWHGSIAGKGRQIIMLETIQSSLKFPVEILIPEKTGKFKPDVYHQYVSESVDFFASKEISEMMVIEKKPIDKKTESDKETTGLWREIYSTIPQLNKLGADEKSPINSNGVILTEDLMVGFYDEGVLHIVLVWAKSDPDTKELGWVLPGKRDRAYDKTKGDISVEDANCSLVEKEIDMDRSHVVYHVVLGYFDDRKREQRMKSSGFVSFVLLDKKPNLVSSKRISVPLNALEQLARREIKIPQDLSSTDSYGLIRNHDSLLLSIFETTKFYHLMDKLNMHEAKYRELLLKNQNSTMPKFSDFDSYYECEICTDLMVGSKIICGNGHSICSVCCELIVKDNAKCPICRQNTLAQPIPNIILEKMIQNQYPAKYAEKYETLTKKRPNTWKDYSLSNGKYICMNS